MKYHPFSYITQKYSTQRELEIEREMRKRQVVERAGGWAQNIRRGRWQGNRKGLWFELGMEELEIYSSGSVLASTLKRADKILMDFRNCYYKKKKRKKKWKDKVRFLRWIWARDFCDIIILISAMSFSFPSTQYFIILFSRGSTPTWYSLACASAD